MSEPAVPIAYGVPMPMAPPSTSSSLSPHNSSSLLSSSGSGRSSRVFLPQQESPVNIAAMESSLLAEQGYTRGLVQALATNRQAFALSIWVIDNSGSMQTRDGHRIVEQNKNKNKRANSEHEHGLKFVECTRWSEMQQTVDYHAQMAALLRAPTVFRMLNDPGCIAGPQQFSIATGEQHGITSAAAAADSSLDRELAVAQQVMLNSQPGGVTPLARHVLEIREDIVRLEPQLRQNGTKVAVVLATDGLPTDAQGYSNGTVKAQFVHALRSLEGLPVWIVVRLCTDEDEVVQYWNDLDAQLELSLEVLDDFVSEAQEVHECNKWLNYGLPLHRMREMGFHHRIFDLLDERKLSKDELRDFCKILFGSGLMDEAVDPEGDWKGFCQTISRLLADEKKQWNPVTKRMEPWIDLKKLHREYDQLSWHGLW